MRCAHCNTDVPDSAKFCQQCGTRLAVVCPQCNATLLPHASSCTECGTTLGAQGAPVPSTPADGAFQRLQRMIPKEFAERLLATRGQVARERRTVTILFSDVKGSTAMAEQLDPEEWMEIMDGAFEILIGPVYRYEGTVARLMGDAILAFFGAPIAHENDPERACRAALEIVEGAGKYARRLEQERGLSGFNVRVGINTGLVVVGEVGSDLRVEYTAMGNTINLAARMESAARPGTVLITEATQRLIAPLFETEALGSLEVKGKATPVPAYRLHGARAQPERVRGLESRGISSPLVGRDTELQVISNCIDRLVSDQGSILFITGDAGVGKSRLLAEMHQSAVSAPLQWLEGRTLSFGQTISYWPFQEILWQYTGISEDDSEATAWHKLESKIRALFAEQTPEILPYLATLLALEMREEYVERVKYLDGEAMGRQVFLVSRRFFERLAQERPLVLVFEDLHWADESSALLLEHLLPLVERVPLLIVGVSRPYREAPAERLQKLASENYPDRTSEIHLGPLAQADSVQLVRNLLATEDLSFQVRETILRKAEGNPFFLEEIIRTLIDMGAVMHDSATGRWRATAQIETLTIPDTVQGVIMARVDRLDEDVKKVLRTASVIGRSFLYRVLRSVAEVDQQLQDHLTRLQEIQFIREKQRLPELEYIFQHALAQEATYESILLHKRRELHAQVGQVIETLFADRLEEFYGLLAYHYAQAEAWEQAQAYLLKAGDQASRVAADSEALAHYRQAMAAYARAFGDEWDPLQRATLERKMGEALFRRGENARALECMQRSLSYLGRPLPAARWGVRLGILRAIVQQIAHRLLPGLLLPVRATRASASELPNPVVEEEVRLYELIGWIEAWTDQERLLLAALSLMNVAERAGFPRGIVVGATGLGLASDFIPIFWLAGAYHQRAVALAEQIDDPSAQSLAYHCLGLHELYLGELEAVVEHSQHAARLYQGVGDLHGWGTATMQRAYALADRGDLSQALGLCQDAVLLGREGDDSHVVCQGLEVQALVLQRLGRLDGAIEVVSECIELAEATSLHSSRVAAGGTLGLCYLCQGELELALSMLHATQQAYVKYGATGGTATSLRIGLAETYLVAAEQTDASQQSERAEWLKQAKRACRDALKLGRLYGPMMPAAMRLRGTYEWLRGERAAAQKWWQRSLVQAEEAGERYYLGLTLLETGRRLGDRAHLQRAEAILAAIGAEWDLARAREALEGTRLP